MVVRTVVEANIVEDNSVSTVDMGVVGIMVELAAVDDDSSGFAVASVLNLAVELKNRSNSFREGILGNAVVEGSLTAYSVMGDGASLVVVVAFVVDVLIDGASAVVISRLLGIGVKDSNVVEGAIEWNSVTDDSIADGRVTGKAVAAKTVEPRRSVEEGVGESASNSRFTSTNKSSDLAEGAAVKGAFVLMKSVVAISKLGVSVIGADVVVVVVGIFFILFFFPLANFVIFFFPICWDGCCSDCCEFRFFCFEVLISFSGFT